MYTKRSSNATSAARSRPARLESTRAFTASGSGKAARRRTPFCGSDRVRRWCWARLVASAKGHMIEKNTIAHRHLETLTPAHRIVTSVDDLPALLTPEDVGALLRTTKKAIYSIIDRGQLPGVVRIGRRVLIRKRELLDFLDHNCTPSRKEKR
jgi:excisionase family DNA binding protein